MIKVMATNIGCEHWLPGEQQLLVRGKGLLFFAQLAIYSVDGKYDKSYRDVEQFLSEWTDIKYVQTVTDDVEFGVLKLVGSI